MAAPDSSGKKQRRNSPSEITANHDESGLLALLQPLSNNSVTVRRSASRQLIRLSTAQHLPEYCQLLATQKDRAVCLNLVAIVGKFDVLESIAALTEALASPDSLIGEAAASTLARYNSPEAFEALLAGLDVKHNPDNWRQRRFCAQALGELGDRRAVPNLLQALRDPHDLVTPAVAHSLEQIGDSQALADLRRVRHHSPHQRGVDCALCLAIDAAIKTLTESKELKP